MAIKAYKQQIGLETPNLPSVPNPGAVEGAFGGDIARATQYAGQVGQQMSEQLAAHVEKQKKLQNDAFVADQEIKYRQELQDRTLSNEMETGNVNGQQIERPKGMLNRQGLNSVGSTVELDEWQKKTEARYLQEIKDPELRDRVRRTISDKYYSTRDNVISHEAKQTREGYISNLQGSRDLQIQDAGTLRTQDQINAGINKVAVLQDQINKANGLGNDQSQIEFRKTVSKFVENISNAKLIEDPTGDTSRAIVAGLSDKLPPEDAANLTKDIDKKVAASSSILLDDLNSKFIDGTITLEDIQSANRPKEKGGIGADRAKKMLRELTTDQAKLIDGFREDNEAADKYVTAAEEIFKGQDEYKAKQILVDAMSDGFMSRQEAQKINRLTGIMKKQKNTRENSIWTQIPIIKNWNVANETDNKEMANAISNYTTYLDQGLKPEEAQEKVLRQQYNQTYPQAPLGEDDKVFDPKREREMSFVPVQRFFKGIVRGGAATVEDFGNGLEWLGAKEAGKAFEEWGKTAKDFYKIEDPTYVDQLAEGLGSMTTFFIPGLGVSKGVQIMKIAPGIARWLGVGVSTVLEGITESGGTYKQAIENGYGEKSASLSATSSFWANIPMIALTDRLGVFGDKGPKILQVLTSGAMEGAQEFTQSLIGNIALSDPINWKDATVSGSIGFITGSGIKSAETVTQTLDELGVAKDFVNKLKSERGSTVNPFNDGKKEPDKINIEGQPNIPEGNITDSNLPPLEINPKESANIDSMKNDPLNFKTAEEYVASKNKDIQIFRGETISSENRGKGGIGYYSEDKSFATLFTHSGMESELKSRKISSGHIYDAREHGGELPSANNESSFDKGMADAKAKGYSAFKLSEGKGQPDSIYIFDKKALNPLDKSKLIAEWEAAKKENQKKVEDSWEDTSSVNIPESNSQFEGLNDKQLVKELSDLVSQFDAGQVTTDMDGNYQRNSSSFLPQFSEKGYTKKYLQNIYDKYIAGEKLTPKQSEDLVYTLNSFKEMFGIKPTETIPDIVTSDDIKRNKANQAIVKKLGQMLSKPIPASKVKGIIRESTGQVKEQGGQVSERTAFLQSLKDRVKAAKQATDFTREQIFDTQNDLINLINQSDLEASDKAKFLTMIKNVQTPKDLADVMKGKKKKTGEVVTPGLEERIDTLIEKEERRQLVGGIKKAVDRAKSSKSIAVDYVNTIEQMVEDVDLKNRKPETIDRIQKMKDFLDNKIAKGEDVEVTRGMLKDLKILDKKKFEDLSNEDLQSLEQSIEKAVQLGETKLKALENTRETRKAKMLEELVKGSVPIKSKEVTQKKVGQKLSAGEKFRNNMNEGFNKAQEKDLAITPADVVFDVLDGNQNYKGPNYKIFKETVDKAHSKYLAKREKIVEAVQKAANELKLDESSLERIGFYAAKVQKGGVEKLESMGYTKEEINAVELNEKEMKLYELMRQKLDELRPEIQEVMRVAYNKDLDVVDDYFPFMTDFEAMSDKELRDRFGESVELFGQANKKNVEKGFTISRTGGKQKIKLNALEVFYNHVDNAVYLIEMGPTIKDLGDIAETEEYGQAVGEIGQERVREWIDLLARKGGVNSRRIRLLDNVRKHVGVATLGFKLSSALIQPTALLDGASLIGARVFQGAYNVATNREWRVFLKENFPELRARGADDPAYLEFGGQEMIDKAGRAGFWALRNIDMLTASSVVAGAYQNAVEEKGGQVDFSKPDQDAIVEAQRILRRTQASAFPKDLPSAISQGGLTGNVSLDKLLLQFQTFMINRWSLIRHDMWAAGIKEGEYGKALNIFFFLAMANMAEIGIRRFSKELLANMTKEDIDDWPETFNKEVVSTALGNVPFVSQAVSAVNYGSIPVPSVDMGARIIKRLNAAANAKKESTRDRNLVRALTLGLGVLFKVPGTAQGEQIVRALTGEDNKKKKTRSAF